MCNIPGGQKTNNEALFNVPLGGNKLMQSLTILYLQGRPKIGPVLK